MKLLRTIFEGGSVKPHSEVKLLLFLSHSTSLENLPISKNIFTRIALKYAVGDLGLLPPMRRVYL